MVLCLFCLYLITNFKFFFNCAHLIPQNGRRAGCDSPSLVPRCGKIISAIATVANKHFSLALRTLHGERGAGVLFIKPVYLNYRAEIFVISSRRFVELGWGSKVTVYGVSPRSDKGAQSDWTLGRCTLW